MAKLRQITLVLDDNEVFVAASAQWEVKGAVDGIAVAGGATTNVSTKGLTDAAKSLIAAVIAEGPQVPT